MAKERVTLNHVWGRRSKQRMQGCEPQLISIMNQALMLSKVDMTVCWRGGLRTLEMQQQLFQQGSTTKDGVHRVSKHQLGKAIDVMPYINGKPSNSLAGFWEIARRIRAAAVVHGTTMRWGGCWEAYTIPRYRDIDPEILFNLYVDEGARKKKRPFIDLYHFETA